MRHTRIVIFILALAFLVAPAVLPATVFAADPDPSAGGLVKCTGEPDNPCGFTELVELMQRIVNYVLYLAVFLAAGLLSWGGILHSTGVEKNISQAYEIFSRTGKGFIWALAMWLVVFTITSVLLNTDDGYRALLGAGGWYTLLA